MSRTRAPNPQRANTTRTETTADGQPPSSNFRITGTLRLRADRTETETGLDTDTAEERHIRWAEDVVDNEGQGKKSSKVCCIFHKSRSFGESSSESESDSSSSDNDSDSEVDNGEARMRQPSCGRHPHRHQPDGHDHDHDHDHGEHDHDQNETGGAGDDDQHRQTDPRTRRPARRKPNAYERVPRYSKGSQTQVEK